MLAVLFVLALVGAALVGQAARRAAARNPEVVRKAAEAAIKGGVDLMG